VRLSYVYNHVCKTTQMCSRNVQSTMGIRFWDQIFGISYVICALIASLSRSFVCVAYCCWKFQTPPASAQSMFKLLLQVHNFILKYTSFSHVYVHSTNCVPFHVFFCLWYIATGKLQAPSVSAPKSATAPTPAWTLLSSSWRPSRRSTPTSATLTCCSWLGQSFTINMHTHLLLQVSTTVWLCRYKYLCIYLCAHVYSWLRRPAAAG
jgi:hypothetical protein